MGRMIRAIITRKHIKSKTRATIPQVLQYFNSVGGKQFWIVKNCKTCGCHHPWYYSFKIMAVCETSWLFTNYAWPKICRKFELGKTENKSKLVARAVLGTGTVWIRLQRHDRPLSKKLLEERRQTKPPAQLFLLCKAWENSWTFLEGWRRRKIK